VHCSAISDAVLEAELFGHVREVSGVPTLTPGLFEQARGGTVFLDEIGELSASTQAKLLRVLQEHEVLPVGGQAAVRVDGRVVASTNVNLEAAVAARHFRQDLFFRLAVFLIRVPPLRERRQDIPLLVDHFSRAAALRAGRAVSLSPGAIARLRQPDWPGNVRELENAVERLVASARGSVIEAADVMVDSAPSAPTGTHPFADMPTLDELERRYLVYALQRFQGNRTRTAAALGIDRRTLYRMSARLGVPITATDMHPDPATT
jgi:DNA-binding NtrC family response regulator